MVVDSALQIIEGKGINLQGLETSPLKNLETLEICAETLQFTPHINPPVQVSVSYYSITI